MATLINRGDQLRAEKVSIEAMKIEHKGVFARTGHHEGQLAIAERNVVCVIEKEMVLAKHTPMRPSAPRREPR